MEGGEVDLLGIYELVIGGPPDVVNVVDKEWIGGCMSGKENYLCTS